MKRYRKKPVVIEAVQFTGDNYSEVEAFTGGEAERRRHGDVVVATLEGEMRASPGDFIIRGVQGEYYPCKPDIFASTYEEVSD